MTLEARYHEVRAHVGEVFRSGPHRLTARELQRFAVACGDTGSAYAEGGVAPPLFLGSVLGWDAGPAEEELRPDGSGGTETGGLPLSGLRLMGAGQELEFHVPVTSGADVVVESSVDDVELKRGRSGDLLLVRIRRRYVDAAGVVLTTCRETFIARGAA